MKPLDRKQSAYLWLCGFFVAALITADIVGGKLFRVFGHDLSAGMLAFPLTFLLTDIVNEFYGAKATRRLTFIGLASAIFSLGIIWIARVAPTSPESPLSASEFERVFGWSVRLYFASLSAYLVGQMLDIGIFSFLRKRTRHRYLWLRATGSTLASQWIDTLVVNFGLWTGTKSIGFILTISRDSYVVKVMVAVGLTPLVYLVHAILARGLQIPEDSEQ
ncbi:MAG: queuosine precursor transporter [Deltaproteobacteria bacterium]|nr:queuosine precursor transporter [Deltaproteobacteria bacterium]